MATQTLAVWQWYTAPPHPAGRRRPNPAAQREKAARPEWDISAGHSPPASRSGPFAARHNRRKVSGRASSSSTCAFFVGRQQRLAAAQHKAQQRAQHKPQPAGPVHTGQPPSGHKMLFSVYHTLRTQKGVGHIRQACAWDDFECAPRCSAHSQRNYYLKFRVCRALRSAPNAFSREGPWRETAFAAPLSAKAQRCGKSLHRFSAG